ncbi:Six-hairpin glycosidase [Myxozyma melibiosi]|uniref:Six-hairpin glycosidase n=1 Tax=Myxozyma melibiosi TaxID=54550 RepID=A0ABR1F2J2_9ASCO
MTLQNGSTNGNSKSDSLLELFSPSAVAKIWGTAFPALNEKAPPTSVPDYTDDKGNYIISGFDWWTSGFFPGSLATLLERAVARPDKFPTDDVHVRKLEHAVRWWSESLHIQAPRRDTHDLGFMIVSAFKPLYELTGDKRAFASCVVAAHALASRFVPEVGCIRSWDSAVNKDYSFTDPNKEVIVIIDNMCNLNMLYWVAQQTGDQRLSDIATTHAETTLKHHFMHPKWGAHHVLVYDKATGAPIYKIQNQGYKNGTVWSRGQAWALLGYAETYGWTKNSTFLDAAIKIAEYFISQLPEDGVPHWDFDAPRPTFRDTSAAMIAANGILVIYQYTRNPQHLAWALNLLKSTVALSLSPHASFTSDEAKPVEMGGYDTILKNATINNNENAFKRLADSGLVYADYYFLTAGNRLLNLGLY